MAKKKAAAGKKGAQKQVAQAPKARRKKSAARADKILYAVASPRSMGGISLFEGQHQIDHSTVANFFSDGDVIQRAVGKLRDAGFEVLQITRTMINFSGPKKLFDHQFKTEIYAEERPVIKSRSDSETAEFFDTPDTPIPGLISTIGTGYQDVLEGVAIEEPRYFMAPSILPPQVPYWHLDVPGDVSLGCNADRAHRLNITGQGIKVAMVDSGWFRHPFFAARGYRVAAVTLGPAASQPDRDDSGHGTGESANIFAVAPDIELFPVKMNFVNSTGAFNAAVGLRPDIITCSWGSHTPQGPLSAADQALAAAIAAAVASGIAVIFSAGNGHAGFPGQHPDVISAGGVFMAADGSLRASDYASGFESTIYPGRRVPDLSGLVGMKPKAIYIMLPLEPRDEIDGGNSGGTYPNGDQTSNDDGWAAFSGTSAAAPQLAGAAALVKQACPTLAPAEIKGVLMTTARDVTTGHCNAVSPLHTGLPAGVGPDTATGNGLVDAHRAALAARVMMMGPAATVSAPELAPLSAPIRSMAELTQPAIPQRRFPFDGAAAPGRLAPEPRVQDMDHDQRLSSDEVQAIQQLIIASN